MSRGLLLSVRFHDGRYHGTGDWPPSPARLFQALVSGAARGAQIELEDEAALAWLEHLPAPIIAAPFMHAGRGFTNFVPNNDLDAVGGDPRRVGEIRAGKIIRPRIFNAEIPFLYAWTFADGEEDQAKTICTLAERLYQLGRGVDMAWAWGESLDGSEIAARLEAYAGVVYRPGGDAGISLACPQDGSLASLLKRFKATRKRFSAGAGKEQLFTKPPKARFATIAYDSPPRQLLFELRGIMPDAPFVPWPFTKAVALVERLRDGAANRLTKALPGSASVIDRIFIGRDASEADKAMRLRILPLPSIGHAHVDHAIRRVLIEIPPNCPMAAEDIAWSFSGLEVASDQETGEIWSLLVSTDDDEMLKHFGFVDAYRTWRTVTPAALPQTAARRRIAPERIRDRAEQKGAPERMEEEVRAARAVRQALRHVQVEASIEIIRVQREPFEAKGARVETFVEGRRFAKERLWHVEIAFAKAVRGPLVLGDGRYLGLGLFAPVREPSSIFVFSLNGEKALLGQEAAIAAAARRAVLARVQGRLDRGAVLPAFFTGHEPNGAPHRPGHHAHLFYAVDLASAPARLLIIAPHVVEHRIANKCERTCLHSLEQALADFAILRAGKAGLFKLLAFGAPGTDDPLCGFSRTWISATPYRSTRHAKRNMNVEEALTADVLCECARRNLPRPEVEVVSYDTGPRGGVKARLRLTFFISVEGPILLGWDAHEGGGVFEIESLSPQ